MSQSDTESAHQKWAYFRFAVVGKLLMNPPKNGELGDELERLARVVWTHPITEKPVQFAFSTIETWYYKARRCDDPTAALKSKVRNDKGLHKSLPLAITDILKKQYRFYPSWSYRLHYDNLGVEVKKLPKAGKLPSYWTVFRYMKAAGLIKTKRRGGKRTDGVKRAEARVEKCEVRSYEVEHVNAMWHLDFHHASRQILIPSGEWVTPLLLGVIDDCSRLICHAQWYLAEDTECLIHGVCQALQKRALPRMIMTDNGSAMKAGETVQGLKQLGVLQEFTLPYSPYQNGKQEVFWAQVEGRLLPMLENVENLSLNELNEATQAWVEMEYNRKKHSSLPSSPVQRFSSEKDVGRPAPDSETLRDCFTIRESRKQRRGDGTISIAGIRYEIPSRFRNVERVTVRFARWDLSRVFMVDATHDTRLCPIFPLDKSKNADGQRRTHSEPAITNAEEILRDRPNAPAPLLQELQEKYAATGLPPAYISKDETKTAESKNTTDN